MSGDERPAQATAMDADGQPMRAGNRGSAERTTYTRSSMENGTLAARRRVQPDAPADAVGAGDDGSETGEATPDVAMQLLAAHEEERTRLAEELHDGPAQALANAIFQTQLLERAMRDDPDAAQAELISLRQLLERELDALRGYINQLRPALDEAEGLDDALRDAASAFGQRTGLPIDVRLDAPGTDLHAAARTAMLRVAQEALRNVAKHADASRAWLTTSMATAPDGSRRWILEVGDDGRGFDYESVAAHPDRRHFGLRFMRERAELLGSQLSVESRPAAGTVVRLIIVTATDRS